MFPRRCPFILTGLLGGLRWGEAAALHTTDIDWKRGALRALLEPSSLRGREKTGPPNNRARVPESGRARHAVFDVHRGRVGVAATQPTGTRNPTATRPPSTAWISTSRYDDLGRRARADDKGGRRPPRAVRPPVLDAFAQPTRSPAQPTRQCVR